MSFPVSQKLYHLWFILYRIQSYNMHFFQIKVRTHNVSCNTSWIPGLDLNLAQFLQVIRPSVSAVGKKNDTANSLCCVKELSNISKEV